MKPTVNRKINTEFSKPVPVDDAQRVEDLTREYIEAVLGSFQSYGPALSTITKAFNDSINEEYKRRCNHKDELQSAIESFGRAVKI